MSKEMNSRPTHFWEYPDFHPGGHKDKVDFRDFQFREIGMAIPPFDWDKGFDIEAILGFKLPVKNQDGSFSCGGQAWSQYLGVLECFGDKSFEERSAKFIYAQTFVPGGGSAGRDNCNVCIKQGCARESVLPSYDDGNPPSEAFMERSQDITIAVRDDGTLARTLSYALVDADIDLVAQAIEQNYGCIIGLNGSNNGTWGSIFPQSPTSSEKMWGHWMYAGKAKKIEEKKYIGVLNSWGRTIGEEGWQWISEDYFIRGFLWKSWTMLFNNASLKPVFKHIFNRDLRVGEKGDEIKALQTALKLDGEFIFPSITGFYGDITRKAVHDFQIRYGIPDDGTNGNIVGPKTRGQLNKMFA